MKVSPTKHITETDHGNMVILDIRTGVCMSFDEDEMGRVRDACAALLHDIDQAREAIVWETESERDG